MMFRIKIRLVLQCKYIITYIGVVTNKYGEADERRDRSFSVFFSLDTHAHVTHAHMNTCNYP